MIGCTKLYSQLHHPPGQTKCISYFSYDYFITIYNAKFRRTNLTYCRPNQVISKQWLVGGHRELLSKPLSRQLIRIKSLLLEESRDEFCQDSCVINYQHHIIQSFFTVNTFFKLKSPNLKYLKNHSRTLDILIERQ